MPDLIFVPPPAPLDKGSKIEEMVRAIRTRKGLKVRASSHGCRKFPWLIVIFSAARYSSPRYLLRQALRRKRVGFYQPPKFFYRFHSSSLFVVLPNHNVVTLHYLNASFTHVMTFYAPPSMGLIGKESVIVAPVPTADSLE